MGPQYDSKTHQACFETKDQISYIYTVRNFKEGCERLSELEKEGVGAVELCGAFGADGAKKMIEQTHNKIAIGYVTHNPEQDDLFDAFFGN